MKQPPFLNSCHQVKALTRANWVPAEQAPWGKGARGRGSKAEGKAFERALYRSLLMQSLPEGTKVAYNPWIQFVDSGELHYAQPDLLIMNEKSILVLECKRTQTPFAFDQLWYLYKPLLEFMYPSREIILCQVCKNLRMQVDGLCYSLLDALGLWRAGITPTLLTQGDIRIA